MEDPAQPNNPAQQQADYLLATQKLLRATLDASRDRIQVFQAVRNQQGQIVDFIWILTNHTAAKIYGDVIGKSLLLFQPGVVEEGIFDAFKLVVETGEPQHYEKQCVHEPFDEWVHQSVVKLNDGVATTTADITDRKKAEQQLMESRDMLQALMDAPNTGISTYSAMRNPAGEITDFRCDFVNKRTLAAFQGHDPTGMRVSQFGADGVEQLPFFKAVIETGQKNTYTRKAESGIVEGWFLFSNAPLGPDRLSQVWEDITELKKAEQQILRLTDEVAQKATNKYYSIFNSMDEGFYLCEVLFDEAGKPVDMLCLEENPAAVRMMGQSVVGKRLRAISPLYEKDWYQIWGDAALRGATQRLERYSEADQKWFNFLVSKFSGEASRQLTVTFQDITQRKRREASSRLINEVTEQLLQDERIDESITSVCQKIGVYFGAAVCAFSELNEEQGTVQAPYIWHVSGVIAPTGVYKISEYHSAEVQALMRSNQPEIVTNSHDFSPAVAARYQALGIGSYVNLPFVRDGKWRATLTISKAQPYPWHQDEIDLMRDLTVRIRTKLERVRAEEALKQADRRKDEFLAMLAHELRNPMSTIRSGLQILGLTTGENELLGTTTAMMRRQTDHLVRMVDDLLDVSRISRGKITLKKERVNLVELVSQAVESVQALYQEQGQRLQVDLPTAPLYLEGDATRLTQVVANLLTNGARYTGEQGQVWLSLTYKAGSPDRQKAILQVRDNGIGLPADQLSTIFELFVQVDNSTARSKGGLGLGLTLVKRLVEMHGGRVEAQSEGLAKGSTFTVHLPTLTTTAEPTPTAASQSTNPAATQRILVIDDNPDAAFTLAMLLKLKGYEAHTRHSGRSGIEAAESLQPWAILLDIGMPGMDGYETCRALRQQPWGQSVVVIALTGYGQDEDRQRTGEAGFDGHLVKPVDLGELTKMLTDLLHKG